MKTSYREAMRAALREALAGDPRVFLMGHKCFLACFSPEYTTGEN